MLAAGTGYSLKEEAVRQMVNELIGNRVSTAIARVDNCIRDVWIADAAVPGKYKPENETIELRYWDGRVAVG